MKGIKHSNEDRSRKYTIMLIPNSMEKPIQINISLRVIASILAFLVISATVMGFHTGKYFMVAEKLKESEKSLAQITDENQKHKENIAFLLDRYNTVESKIEELKEIESKVITVSGGKDLFQKEENQEVEQGESVVSRSALRSYSEGTDFELNLEELDEQFAKQEEIIRQLNVNIDEEIERIKRAEKIARTQDVPDRWPTVGRLTSGFGNRISPFSGRKEFHTGIDLANSLGTPVYAAAMGVVTYSGYKGSYGNVIIIYHGKNGYSTVYAHNSKLLVEVGDSVKKGDLIAKMGSTGSSTGSHLHFEIRMNNEPINPLNVLE